MIKPLFFILSLLAYTTCVLAGPRDGGGGDMMYIIDKPLNLLPADKVSSERAQKIKDYLNGQIRDDLVQKLSDYQTYHSADLVGFKIDKKYHDIVKIFNFLDDQSASFINDILNTPYALSDEPVFAWCGDQDLNEKDAATCGQKLNEIKFNINRIARYDLSFDKLKKALLQLLFHEHVRHFGFNDKDHELARLSGILENDQTSIDQNRAQYLKLLKQGDPENQNWLKIPHLLDWYRIDYIQGGYDQPENRWVDLYVAHNQESETLTLLKAFKKSYADLGFDDFDIDQALKNWKELSSIHWYPFESSHRLANAICRSRANSVCPTDYALLGPSVMERVWFETQTHLNP